MIRYSVEMVVPGEIRIFETTAALNDELASCWVAAAHAAIQDHGCFNVALAGGSTPKSFYQYLAQTKRADESLWQHTQVFFGDERYVPRDHADSNFRMANEVLFSRVPIPVEQVHPMVAEDLTADECADRYSRLLVERLPKDESLQPTFDLILLGLGTDGHTASLFPGTALLQEQEKPVAAQYVERLASWRISLTFPVINAARQVIFLVTGEGKAAILNAVFNAAVNESHFPAQRVCPQGELLWFVDHDAAGQLSADHW